MSESETISQPITDTGPRLGLFDGISNEDYHRGPGISKSGLDLINRSPAHYQEYRRHPRPATPAMALGTAVHAAILEPDDFAARFRPDPAPGSYSKAAKEERAAMEAEGFVIVHTAKDAGHWEKDDWRAVHAMRDAVMTHPIASILLDPDQGQAEQTAFWIDRDTGRLCKARPDFLNDGHNLCVDLKTTEDASYTEFQRSVFKWRYHVQAAYYSHGLTRVDRPVRDFVFVAIEKSPPFCIGCYALIYEAKRVGWIQAEHDLRTYDACMRSNEWPGYAQEIRELDLKEWQLKGRIS